LSPNQQLRESLDVATTGTTSRAPSGETECSIALLEASSPRYVESPVGSPPRSVGLFGARCRSATPASVPRRATGVPTACARAYVTSSSAIPARRSSSPCPKRTRSPGSRQAVERGGHPPPPRRVVVASTLSRAFPSGGGRPDPDASDQGCPGQRYAEGSASRGQTRICPVFAEATRSTVLYLLERRGCPNAPPCAYRVSIAGKRVGVGHARRTGPRPVRYEVIIPVPS